MSGSLDPLVAAIAVAIEGVLQRGVRVRPEGEGWHIQLAPASGETSESVDSVGSITRSW